MAVPTPDNFQRQFERRWAHLRNPHVRDLAWLLDSPDLLDADAPQWHGQIATLNDVSSETAAWLRQLDRDPTPLHQALALQPSLRLGRYAEQLMRLYFAHRGMLVAHGVQVRSDKSATVGEFDFLLRIDGKLSHWEFATKYYLLEESGAGLEADYFVGPNLADTLGTKMRKIFGRQLALGAHPAAQAHLPEPLAHAQALVKGWLFYRLGEAPRETAPGVSAAHCRGFWCEQAQLARLPLEYGVMLPRLSWLAPARLPLAHAMDAQALAAAVHAYFATERLPVLVALLQRNEDQAIEIDRGFIVPEDWQLHKPVSVSVRRSRPANRIRAGSPRACA